LKELEGGDVWCKVQPTLKNKHYLHLWLALLRRAPPILSVIRYGNPIALDLKYAPDAKPPARGASCAKSQLHPTRPKRLSNASQWQSCTSKPNIILLGRARHVMLCPLSWIGLNISRPTVGWRIHLTRWTDSRDAIFMWLPNLSAYHEFGTCILEQHRRRPSDNLQALQCAGNGRPGAAPSDTPC